MSEELQIQLDRFEKVLEDGLVGLCKGNGLIKDTLSSPDIDGKWEAFVKDYVADAVENINDYPMAAVGFAAFLGMAVAYHWDLDWERYGACVYKDYYGTHGFDDMDDHILQNVLKLSAEDIAARTEALKSCTTAALELLRHEQIQFQTEYGFYALVRVYGVMFRLGVSIELSALGYSYSPA